MVSVEEPHYDDPNATDFVASVARTGRIFAKQEWLLQTLGVEGHAVDAGQYVRVSSVALHAVSVVGYRRPESELTFTGWEIVSASSPTSKGYGLYALRELSRLRLVWIAAMILPTGWAFRFVGQTLVDCVSPQGETREIMVSIDL
jgi:hypothetical protein